MPLEHNPDVGTGGDGLGASALAGTGGGGLGFSIVGGTGGDGICGSEGGGGEEGDFFSFAGNTVVCQGDAVELLVTIIPDEGFTGAVTLSMTGLPSGVSVVFDTNPVTIVDDETPVSATATLTATGSATLGDHTVTIVGTDSNNNTATFAFTLTVESCDVAELRFSVEETVNWDIGGNHFMFRVQDAGSDDVFRIQSETDVADSTQTPTPRAHRFSPNGQILAVWYAIDENQPTFKHLARVYDLGPTLTSGGAWGTYDGQAQPDVYVLDADMINEVESAIDDNWMDISVDDDGALYILEGEEIPDEVQSEMEWHKANNNPQFDTDSGRTSFITVIADPRGPDTSQAALSFTKCCSDSTGLEVTATPVEAWWSATPSPTSGTCQAATPGAFCPDPFIEDIHNCFAPRRATCETTITIDITGLANGTYTDDNDDHPGTDIFAYNDGDPASTAICCTLEAPNGDFTGEVLDGSPRKITLVVEIPTREALVLKKKPVGSAITTQATMEIDDTIYTTVGGGSDPNAVTKILNPAQSLIVTEYTSSGSLDATFNEQVVVLNMTTGEAVFTVPRLSILDNQAPEAGAAGTQSGSRCIRPFYGETKDSPGTFKEAVIVERNDAFSLLFFTNTSTDLYPEYEDFLGSAPQQAPLIVLSDDRTGYAIGCASVFDKHVRTITAAAEADEITATALPSAVVVTPGQTETAAPRGLEPYDVFSFPVANEYRAEVWGMALVIT